MKLLIVDDDRITRELLEEVFGKEGYAITIAESAEEAIEKLNHENFPLILTDIRMLETDGIGLLEHIQSRKMNSVVTLMTGFGTMDGAIKAIQKGAFDYISKPFRLEDIKAILSRAAQHWNQSQDKSSPLPAASPFQDTRTLIGKSPKIVEVYKTLARATLSPSNVLIVGESGTGKELVARGIHENSPRKTKKFVAINCGALTETLLESELFGHVRGAFTGAVQNKHGLFHEADAGTLF